MKKPLLNRWQKYFDARENGLSVDASAKRARLDKTTCYRFERGDPTSTGIIAADILGIHMVAGNLVGKPIDADALTALDDFAFFRRRYTGRKSLPWQERAAYDVLRALETKEREYIVTNMPPGSGKSTLFTHDIPCWLIARDRTIRMMIGSRTERQARMYVGRIKKTLERDAPMRTDADSLALGIAFDADATMQDDYGSFRPEGRSDLWRAEGLVVRQLDGVSLDDKEPTVSAWGQDSGFLGGRFDLVIWDDLVDRKNTRTPESKEMLREWWGIEAETRLEPGGCLILQGQRIAHDDLYRHALDMRKLDDTPKYRHIVYQAHDDDNCANDHGDEEQKAAWPDGCLLDPHRLPWTMLETIKKNNPRVYEVQYQQNDGDIVGGLIDPIWITGGVDRDGYHAPGCLDTNRLLEHVPDHLTDGRGWSFVTVDPSPTEFWSIQWWIYDPTTENRYLIDHIRARLNPEDFLSLDLDVFEFTGIVPRWRKRAGMKRAPITHIVVEVNAAQRWLLSQPHVQRYIDITGINFVPHTTHINKADPKFGLESIGDLFRQGKIRLPWEDHIAREAIEPMIREGQTYPDGDTTDTLMACWFAKLAVEHHYTPNVRGRFRQERPAYLAGAGRGMAGFYQ